MGGGEWVQGWQGQQCVQATDRHLWLRAHSSRAGTLPARPALPQPHLACPTSLFRPTCAQEEKERQRLESLKAARLQQAGSAASRPLMIRTGKARTEGGRRAGGAGVGAGQGSLQQGGGRVQDWRPAAGLASHSTAAASGCLLYWPACLSAGPLQPSVHPNLLTQTACA